MKVTVKCSIHADGDPAFKSVVGHLTGRTIKDVTALHGSYEEGAYLLFRFEDGATAKIYIDHFYNKDIEVEYS